MFCPKCGGTFISFKTENTEGFRCKTCGGLWFQTNKNYENISEETATAIDHGNSNIGKIYDLLTDVLCPTCEKPMASVTDPEQEHLRYELCGTCFGVYFDAGEFSDFVIKSENLSRVRDLLATKK